MTNNWKAMLFLDVMIKWYFRNLEERSLKLLKNYTEEVRLERC